MLHIPLCKSRYPRRDINDIGGYRKWKHLSNVFPWGSGMCCLGNPWQDSKAPLKLSCSLLFLFFFFIRAGDSIGEKCPCWWQHISHTHKYSFNINDLLKHSWGVCVSLQRFGVSILPNSKPQSQVKEQRGTEETTPGRLFASCFHLLKSSLWWGSVSFQGKARMSKCQGEKICFPLTQCSETAEPILLKP